MKPAAVPLLAGLGILCFGIRPDFAANDARKVPLDSVYTTTRQQDTKDALAELKGFPPLIYGKPISGEPVIFLVNGHDFPAAVKASEPFFQLEEAIAPDPIIETKGSEPIWVGAYLGSTGSQPPAYRVRSVEVKDRKVRVTYETIDREFSTMDHYSYLLWAPLGRLPAGDYTLELYDTAAQEITATRRSKVVAE